MLRGGECVCGGGEEEVLQRVMVHGGEGTKQVVLTLLLGGAGEGEGRVPGALGATYLLFN